MLSIGLLEKRVVCLVETGWKGVRELSIDLVKRGVPSLCIIKGKLDKEILEIITKYEKMSPISIRRKIFKLYIVMIFLKNYALGNTICIIMDSKKNYPWVRAINKILAIKTILLVEKRHNYTSRVRLSACSTKY